MTPALDLRYTDHSIQRTSRPRGLGKPFTVLFRLPCTTSDEVHDMICVGFGPASLAIAVALHDALEAEDKYGQNTYSPRIAFLEKQNTFHWHAGMLLPGAKMQISFIKDLATVRDPRSHFTFLNYLKQHNRLVQFTNLDTFLPLRIEFEDYLKWAAEHFTDMVKYSQDVTSIRPIKRPGRNKIDCLEVTSKDLISGEIKTRISRNVVIAVGGRPSRPPVFPLDLPGIIHSSEYSCKISNMLPNRDHSYNIAVVGSGQSAAEVFNDLHSRYPNAATQMIFRSTALRPSDDSPFVNEVFNPEAVDEFYIKPIETKKILLGQNQATNYSVVRLGLLEKIYEDLYHQSIRQPNRNLWQHKLLAMREITSVEPIKNGNSIRLVTKHMDPCIPTSKEILDVDAVILATGYTRTAHKEMLQECTAINASSDGQWKVGRDYQIQLSRDLVEDSVGIYLQGCNEATHGLADSLLSILATRGGELVHSIFGDAFFDSQTPINGCAPVSHAFR